MTNISIVIPNFNGIELLKICLPSIYKSKWDNYEIIIVDNGSTDGSCEFIREHHPNVKLIEIGYNSGFSKAVNEGIRASCSDYVFLLNNDLEMGEGCLENLYNCIVNEKNIFSVQAKMINYYDRSKMDDGGNFYSIFGWAFKRGIGRSVLSYTKSKKIFSACAGAAVYNKEILYQMGLFDESYFAYLEDIDLGIKATLSGYKSYFEPSAIIYHMNGGTSGAGKTAFKAYLSGRNSAYNIIKNWPISLKIINAPFYTLGFVIKYAFFMKWGYHKDFKKGVVEAYHSRKELKRFNRNAVTLRGVFSFQLMMLTGVFNK